MTRDLSRLLRPRHIAVFGSRWTEQVVSQCRAIGFSGPIWPVHPTRESVGGARCLRSIDDLPEAPDAAFLGVNRIATVEVVEALSAMGAGGAICFASGFAEAEDGRETGRKLQDRLVRAAGDMPFLGPNCYGTLNYLDGVALWPDQHGGIRRERGVAIIGQSSNVLINLTMQRRGLPVAYVLAAGNQAQVDLARMGEAMLDDDRVTAIGFHIEGISDIRAFEAMARRAREQKVPLVALKGGRSALAREAAVSHTASIAGGDEAGRAFLRRLGIAVVSSLPDFLETLKLLHVLGPQPGRRLVAVSCSGGEAALVADTAEGRNLSLPPLPDQTRGKLSRVLGPLVTIANPLDYHTFIWGDRARMNQAFSAIGEAGQDVTLYVLDMPRSDLCDETAWWPAVEAIAGTAAGRRTVIASTLPETMPEDWSETLIARGIVPAAGLDEALTAIENAADVHAAWQAEVPVPVLLPGSGPGARMLPDEAEAKTALAAHGLATPEGHLAATPAEAGEAARALGGTVVLKALGIAHKTEDGAVRLGLTDPDEVAAAAAAMPAARGFLVERMVDGGVAELLLGVLRDPVYGFTLTLGAGGTLAELIGDAQTLTVPAGPHEVRAALSRLRIAPLLHGYRGRPAGSLDAVLAAAAALQRFVESEADTLMEVEINPLIVTPERAVAADALIRYGGGSVRATELPRAAKVP